MAGSGAAAGAGSYLYVVNREQYADGTFGEVRLVFPSLGMYGGKNLVATGAPVALPPASPAGRQQIYFTIRRNYSAKQQLQTAETFTVIVSPAPLALPPLKQTGLEQDSATILDAQIFADWVRQCRGQARRGTLRGGLGRQTSPREQEMGSRAAVAEAAPLTQSEPAPQYAYRVAVAPGQPALANIGLRFE